MAPLLARRLAAAATALLGVVAALCMLLTAADALDTNACYSTGMPPTRPQGLQLCYMHSRSSCCLSSFDSSPILDAYRAMVPGGPGCTAGSREMRAVLYPLRIFLCLPCAPREPLYRFRTVDGDQIDGGLVPPIVTASDDEYTWRVCRSFINGRAGSSQGLWGINGTHYNRCGVTLQSCPVTPVFDYFSGDFQLVDPSCATSSRLTVPSFTLSRSSDPGVEMLSMVRQAMPSLRIAIVNDSHPAYSYERTPCFGRAVDSARGLAALPSFLPALLVLCLLSW